MRGTGPLRELQTFPLLTYSKILGPNFQEMLLSWKKVVLVDW